jgi:hypothetical protein
MERTTLVKLKSRLIPAVFVALLGSGCAVHAHATEPGSIDAVKAGQWAGPHIAMTVAATGTDIAFDCGKATVSGSIDADRDGAFSVTGTFVQERPGPTTRDGPPRRPMRMTGTVKGDDMQVTIVLTDQNEDVGSFTLTFGATPRLVKCR